MIRHVFIVKKRMGETGNEMFAADQLRVFPSLEGTRFHNPRGLAYLGAWNRLVTVKPGQAFPSLAN